MKILHSESDLVVLEKPCGVGVQSSPNERLPNLVDNWAVENGGEVLRPVHRLDVRASGVVVLARNTVTAAHLSESFRQRRVGKKYAVRLWGTLLNPENEPLRVAVSLTKRDGRAWVDPEGKESVSIFQVVEHVEGRTEAEVRTETGRFHQVRAHAAYLGCPVWGDVRYGAPVSDRLYLHASELSFPHPQTDEPFSVLSVAPWRG